MRRVGKEGERNPRDPLLFGGHKKVATPGSFLDNGFLDIGTSTDSSSEEEEEEN